MSATKLNVLSLNCWGLKLPKRFCQLRRERIEAIGDALAEGRYDLVLLQEVWVQADFDQICRQVFKVLPHSHYFHSGMFGSGLCVFSKHSILETFQHRFPLNGSPFKVFHGDWYGSKSVGLVQIMVNGHRINVYNTHTHAYYKSSKDEYNTHHIVQAFELSQFIRLTSDGCDAVIVGGDLNFTPSQLGYNMVLANGNLLDSWMEQRAEHRDEPGATVNHPENSFTQKSPSGVAVDPKRIDYVLYRSNSGFEVGCLSCQTVLRDVPGRNYSYSDHLGVAASLSIKRNVTAMAPERRTSVLQELYAAAVPQLEDGLSACHNARIMYGLIVALSLVSLAFVSNLPINFPFSALLTGLQLVLFLVIGVCLWCWVVLTYREENCIHSAKKDMENQLRCL